jgi:hypothetical protein
MVLVSNHTPRGWVNPPKNGADEPGYHTGCLCLDLHLAVYGHMSAGIVKRRTGDITELAIAPYRRLVNHTPSATVTPANICWDSEQLLPDPRAHRLCA